MPLADRRQTVQPSVSAAFKLLVDGESIFAAKRQLQSFAKLASVC
jgi:hypothetical protein